MTGEVSLPDAVRALADAWAEPPAERAERLTRWLVDHVAAGWAAEDAARWAARVEECRALTDMIEQAERAADEAATRATEHAARGSTTDWAAALSAYARLRNDRAGRAHLRAVMWAEQAAAAGRLTARLDRSARSAAQIAANRLDWATRATTAAWAEPAAITPQAVSAADPEGGTR